MAKMSLETRIYSSNPWFFHTEASWQISYKSAKHFGGYLECYVFSKEWVSQKKTLLKLSIPEFLYSSAI